MSLFGLVSEKSLKQAQEEISKKDIEIQQLQQTIDDLKDQLLPEHNDIRVLNQQIADLKQSCDLEKNRLTALKDSYFDGKIRKK